MYTTDNINKINITNIKQKLSALAPTHLEIIDDSAKHRGHAGYQSEFPSHISVIITSHIFEGKSLLQRHQMIHELLREELESGLHALSIKANTPTSSK